MFVARWGRLRWFVGPFVIGCVGVAGIIGIVKANLDEVTNEALEDVHNLAALHAVELVRTHEQAVGQVMRSAALRQSGIYADMPDIDGVAWLDRPVALIRGNGRPDDIVEIITDRASLAAATGSGLTAPEMTPLMAMPGQRTGYAIATVAQGDLIGAVVDVSALVAGMSGDGVGVVVRAGNVTAGDAGVGKLTHTDDVRILSTPWKVSTTVDVARLNIFDAGVISWIVIIVAVIAGTIVLAINGFRQGLQLEAESRKATGAADDAAAATAEVVRLENEIERLTRVAAHDMREPLTTIAQILKVAMQVSPDDRPPTDMLQVALEATERQRDAVDGLLAYAKIRRPNRDVINLVDMVEEIQTDLAALISHEDVTITTDLDAAGMVADQRIIRRMLSNLIANAAQYADQDKPERHVHVRSHIDGDTVQIVVADNGVGIPEDVQRRMFTMFSHGLGAAHGAGMGLAIVRRAVELHKARIDVDSTVGEGTTVSIWFPTAIPDRPVAAVGGDWRGQH